MNEDIYVMATTPPDDLTAQLCLFMIQTEMSNAPELHRWLETYLVGNFGFRVRGREQPEEAARDITLRLIRNKWWPEDARSWRKYVAIVRRAIQRPYASAAVADPQDLADPRGTEDQLIAEIDGKRRGAADYARGLGALSPRIANRQDSSRLEMPSPPPAYDPSGSLLTVGEAGRLAGIPLSTVYARIDRGSVAVDYDANGRMIVRRSVLDQMIKGPSVSDVIAAVVRARGCSASTARRQVSRLRRRGLSLEDILNDHVAECEGRPRN